MGVMIPMKRERMLTIRVTDDEHARLLPFLPVCCRDRTERVLAVRTMRRYGKWSGFSGRSDTNNSNTVQIMIFLKYR